MSFPKRVRKGPVNKMTRPGVALRIDEKPSEADVRHLGARLSAFTELRSGRALNARKFAVWLRDADGRLVGGLVGTTYWDWLHIDNLWLDEALRGCGWGRRLLETAERVAVRRGCRGVWLDTRSFQAPAFYERMGYRQFGELEELAPHVRRHWFWKELAPCKPGRVAALCR
jgi:ribosomal protein S18 acetylase RimI-like enzyme